MAFVVVALVKVMLSERLSMRSDSYSEWRRTFSTDPVSFCCAETEMCSNVQLVMCSCVVK